MDASPSSTAMLAAFGRALHRHCDEHPWILDDPYAALFVGPAWNEIAALADQVFGQELVSAMRAWLAVRGRYTEDRLTGGAFTQYVLLGAGLDSLAWRRPDLLRRLTIFEVDHPASQTWKQERVEHLTLPAHDRHVYVPVDFEVESLRSCLDAAGFDWTRPTLFSWLGVTMYLTEEAIDSTLRTVAAAGPGSEVVFTYRKEDSLLDDLGRLFISTFEPLAAQLGEPIYPGRSVKEIEALVTGCGLQVVALPTREEIVARYFANRIDNLRPSIPEDLAVAAVP